VSNVFLHNLVSQKQVLGADIAFDRDADIPMAVFSSADNLQFLTVFTHPGGSGEVSEFQVSNSSDTKHLANPLAKIKRFVTGRGIQLGFTKSRVTSILGAPLHQRSKGRFITFEYRLEEKEQTASEFLAHYNMPIYYGVYTFKNDHLLEFKFGFEYPQKVKHYGQVRPSGWYTPCWCGQ
jgi:hypothetical protein